MPECRYRTSGCPEPSTVEGRAALLLIWLYDHLVTATDAASFEQLLSQVKTANERVARLTPSQLDDWWRKASERRADRAGLQIGLRALLVDSFSYRKEATVSSSDTTVQKRHKLTKVDASDYQSAKNCKLQCFYLFVVIVAADETFEDWPWLMVNVAQIIRLKYLGSGEKERKLFK
jgi:hypothetical protein